MTHMNEWASYTQIKILAASFLCLPASIDVILKEMSAFEVWEEKQEFSLTCLSQACL